MMRMVVAVMETVLQNRLSFNDDNYYRGKRFQKHDVGVYFFMDEDTHGFFFDFFFGGGGGLNLMWVHFFKDDKGADKVLQIIW